MVQKSNSFRNGYNQSLDLAINVIPVVKFLVPNWEDVVDCRTGSPGVLIGEMWSYISKVYLAPCAQLYSLTATPQPPPLPFPNWAHIHTIGRYWSAR
jgi:hypothetical protein